MGISPEFISGIINGVSQAYIGHPLDTIKVLQQNNKRWKDLRLNQLMRGVRYPLYYKIFTHSFCFDLDKKIKIRNNFVRNAVVGLYLSPLTYCIELCKIYRQNGKSIKQISYYDFINYKGFLCTVSRDVISYSLYIPIYMIMKEKKNNTIVSGATAGLINWSMSYPFDVIRTRQITHNKNTLYQSMKMGPLWKGYNACVLRAMLTAIVGFTVYENMIILLK